MRNLFYWPTAVEREVRKRIKVCVAAYAYEIRHDSIMSDTQWDRLAQSVNPKTKTGHAVMDKWFKEKFDPCTGQWIHKHPELDKIAELYERGKQTCRQ